MGAVGVSRGDGGAAAGATGRRRVGRQRPWASGPRRRPTRPGRQRHAKARRSDAAGIDAVSAHSSRLHWKAVMKTPSGLARSSASFFGGSILVVNRPVQLTVRGADAPWSKVVSRHCTW